MKKIKIDPADTAFSLYIRTRDGWTCQRCGRQYVPPTNGLQCSHYFGRRRENTRFDPENCDSLCAGCHQYFGSDNREAYRDFKLKQLGQERHNWLILRANTYKKKDRKLALIVARELLRGIGGRNRI